MLTAGLDIGALRTKAAIVCDGRVLATADAPTGEAVGRTAGEVLAAAAAQAGIDCGAIEATVATGAGRNHVSWATGTATEVVCAARGTSLACPGARGVVDMGGESTRAVKLDERGQVLEYAVNDKCAAGTGVFLDAMATAMGVSIGEMGPLSMTSTANVEVTSLCVAFAESEVVSLVHRQTPKPDILRGIHKSIASRINGLTGRIGLVGECVAIGGLARNCGIVSWLQTMRATRVITPEAPHTIGAIGAALVAAGRLQGESDGLAPARPSSEEQAP